MFVLIFEKENYFMGKKGERENKEKDKGKERKTYGKDPKACNCSYMTLRDDCDVRKCNVFL